MRSKSLWILLLILSVIVPLATAQPNSAQPVSAAIPPIDPRSAETIDLIFEEPTSIHNMYQALGRAWGINILLDPKLRDREISFVLRNVTPQEGLNNLLRTVGQFYSVVDRHSIIIADDTPQNRRTYEHQVIQRFYLENAEVKDMMTIIRSLIGAKHVAANSANNSIVLRDTADKVRVAEQIFASNDRPKAEVVVEVDLLSIDSRELQNLDLQPASEGQSVTAGDVPPRLAAGEVDRLRRQSSARSLAHPSLNIVTGSRGKLRLTDRLPLPSHFADARAESVGQVIYQEVGLGLVVQPWIHSEKDVSLRLEIVVDTLTDWLTDAAGEERPVFGRRNLESSIRLQDGETYLLNGLMIAPEARSAKRGALQLGRFLDHAGDHREVVLALTPQIIRGPGNDGSALAPLWIGTEANIAMRGGDRRIVSPKAGPFDPAPDRGTEN